MTSEPLPQIKNPKVRCETSEGGCRAGIFVPEAFVQLQDKRGHEALGSYENKNMAVL